MHHVEGIDNNLIKPYLQLRVNIAKQIATLKNIADAGDRYHMDITALESALGEVIEIVQHEEKMLKVSMSNYIGMNKEPMSTTQIHRQLDPVKKLLLQLNAWYGSNHHGLNKTAIDVCFAAYRRITAVSQMHSAKQRSIALVILTRRELLTEANRTQSWSKCSSSQRRRFHDCSTKEKI